MARARGWRKVEGTEVGESAIHGRGLFATRTFRKGERIGSFEGVPAKRNGSHVLWYQDESDRWHGRRVLNDIRYANHSSRANAEAWGTELYAARRIRPGEEITFDYGEDFAHL